MVETFDPIGRVVQVRATGPASVEERDVDRVGQIYDRYLGPNELWNKGWRSQQNDDTYVLWTVEPAAGSAVQFPNLLDAGGVFRWTSTQAFHEALAAASL